MHSATQHSYLNLIGPPYSCLLVDDLECQNAFSYGFGPGGAGGIVVYTGFLDEVLNNSPSHPPQAGLSNTQPSDSLFSWLFGVLLSVPRSSYYYQPTEQQTSELAVLLAHELAHLLLAHHLETLSSTSILIPSVTSIFTDVSRAILFPFTMLFGPFVNDALFQFGKSHSGEVNKMSLMTAGRKLEIEAGWHSAHHSSIRKILIRCWNAELLDLVSARLLAYAGFDPREAIKFWEGRIDRSKLDQDSPRDAVGCAIQGKTDEQDWTTTMTAWAMGRESHPLKKERVQRLKEEIDRWEVEWKKMGKTP
jgi:Peptidase family M48